MPAPLAFNPVSASAIAAFNGLLNALPAQNRLELISGTLQHVINPSPRLAFERGILETAVSSPTDSNIDRAFALYQRPGRLFYESARQIDALLSSLSMDLPVLNASLESRREDVIAQRAWWRFEAGAQEFLDMGALYDPVGALSGGIIYYLDQQGLQSHREGRRAGDGWTPPPSLGVLSRQSPERLERYNRGQNDQVGDVDMGFGDDLQMVTVPNVYLDLLRAHLGFHVTIPASEIVDHYASAAWAKSLNPNARILTSIKGLVGGRTPLEHLALVLEDAERENPVIDFLGFASSSKLMREQREFRDGHRKSLETLEVVLATPDANHGLEVATRFAGKGAKISQETSEGIPLTVVENANLPRPVRFVVLSDRGAIRANEKASIDKNLQALRLGGDLLQMMEEQVSKGVPGNDALYAQFAADYQAQMKLAEQDIRKVLELEGIPANKRVILPGVLKDLYGSWGTDDFKNLYKLVSRIFAPDAAEEDWQEAMVLLKLRIRQYYSVRNPCYGFCMAADRAAMMHGRWLGPDAVKATAKRLIEKGEIAEKEFEQLGLNEDKSFAHFFFSMIPEGLVPEGLQIAQQLPERCRLFKLKMQDLPESYRKAFLLVQRLQRSALFDPEVYREIVEVSRDLGHILEGDPRVEKSTYVGYLTRLREHFETGYKLLRASEKVLKSGREAQYLVGRIVGHMRLLIRNIENNDQIGPREISIINQGVIEALTVANLFYILPPEESRQEAEHLNRRLKNLATYAKELDLAPVFPSSKAPEIGLPALSIQMIVGMKQPIFDAVGDRLIELTYDMNSRLHSLDRAITRAEVAKALDRMIKALEEASKGKPEKPVEPMVSFFLGGVVQTFRQIRGLLPRKLNPHDSLLVYQALVESLIHTRRFMVFPDDRAEVEMAYTFNRFFKIRRYFEGAEGVHSPLWYFGNGSSNPPPPPPSGELI